MVCRFCIVVLYLVVWLTRSNKSVRQIRTIGPPLNFRRPGSSGLRPEVGFVSRAATVAAESTELTWVGAKLCCWANGGCIPAYLGAKGVLFLLCWVGSVDNSPIPKASSNCASCASKFSPTTGIGRAIDDNLKTPKGPTEAKKGFHG